MKGNGQLKNIIFKINNNGRKKEGRDSTQRMNKPKKRTKKRGNVKIKGENETYKYTSKHNKERRCLNE